MFLTVVGQTKVVQGLEELMGRGLTVEQTPENIRGELFHRRVFVRRLNYLFDTLAKLKLITLKV